MTRWLPIAGYEGRYEISDDGQVKILAAPGRGRLNADRIKVPSRGERGRQYVLLYDGSGNKPVSRAVHQLVLEAFVGPRPPGALTRHLDDDSTNNHVSNLAWGTEAENTRDLVRNGNHNHARKTHCKHGHLLSGDNLIETSRQRSCRECARRRNAEYQTRKQESA